jgi:hypothetical protein
VYTSGGRGVAGSNPVIPTDSKPWQSIDCQGFLFAFCSVFNRHYRYWFIYGKTQKPQLQTGDSG